MKFKIHQYPLIFPLLLFCVAIFSANQQCHALDITTLPISVNNSKNTVDLVRSVPSFLYRVLINNHFHLSCLPSTKFERFNAEIEVKREAIKAMGCFEFGESDPLYVHRPETDVGFAGDQQLKLLQKKFFRWETAGNNFSLTMFYRIKQMKDSKVISSELFEEFEVEKYGKTKVPQYICRSVSDPDKVGLLSLSDGICRIPEINSKNGTWHLELDDPFQLATNLQKDLNYSWAEVITSKAISGEWIPPPNAVEVEIGGVGKDHLPLYIARLKGNSTFTTVLGLLSGTKILMNSKETKLELLVVDEVLFQVQMRLSGRVKPVNVLAKLWNETLNCKLNINGSISSSSLNGEIKLVDMKMDSSGAALDAFGRNSNKTTNWQIFKKSISISPYWGAGHGGSLFADDAAFVGGNGKVMTNFWHNRPNRLPRHLCRLNFIPERPYEDHWRAGFLDHRRQMCTVSTNWFTHDSSNYEVLYAEGKSKEGKSRLVWTPYKKEQAQQLGAITAGWEGSRKKMFFARLEQFSDPNDGNRTISLYGTITSESDKFYYQTGDYVDHAQELNGAEAAGVQVLSLS